MDHSPENRKPIGKKAALIAALLIALAALGAVFWLLRPQPAAVPALAPDPNVQVGTLGDPAQRQAELNKIVDEGMVTFSINATPFFASGDAEGNLMIENPPENNNRFTVAIYRRDTGDKVYQSGYLDPEQYIESAPLDVALPEGEYPCTAMFETYRLADSSYIGQVAAEITIYVMS